MECLWRLFCHRQPDGHPYQPHPPVFYLHLVAYDGLPDHRLYVSCFLEKYAELCKVGEEESVVLFVRHKPGPLPTSPVSGSHQCTALAFRRCLLIFNFAIEVIAYY